MSKSQRSYGYYDLGNSDDEAVNKYEKVKTKEGLKNSNQQNGLASNSIKMETIEITRSDNLSSGYNNNSKGKSAINSILMMDTDPNASFGEDYKDVPTKKLKVDTNTAKTMKMGASPNEIKKSPTIPRTYSDKSPLDESRSKKGEQDSPLKKEDSQGQSKTKDKTFNPAQFMTIYNISTDRADFDRPTYTSPYVSMQSDRKNTDKRSSSSSSSDSHSDKEYKEKPKSELVSGVNALPVQRPLFILDSGPIVQIEYIDSMSKLILPKKNPDLMVSTYNIPGMSKTMVTQEKNILEKIQKFLSPPPPTTGAGDKTDKEKEDEEEEKPEGFDELDMPTRYFYENVTQTCRRCKQPGHFEKWCSEEQVSRCVLCCGNHDTHECNSIVCFRCNGVGHMAKDCGRNDPTLCYRCNKRGHKSNMCGILVLGGGTDKEKQEYSRDIKCLACNKYGHINCEKRVNSGDYSYSDDLYWDMDRPKNQIATWMDAVKKEEEQEQKYYLERLTGMFSNESSLGLDGLENFKQSSKKDKKSAKKSKKSKKSHEEEEEEEGHHHSSRNHKHEPHQSHYSHQSQQSHQHYENRFEKQTEEYFSHKPYDKYSRYNDNRNDDSLKIERPSKNNHHHQKSNNNNRSHEGNSKTYNYKHKNRR
jgi:hypothetical protein